jgi:hypothetical protein
VLQFSAAELQLALFWMGVPWTLKMLFGQFVDVRPILGSPRCCVRLNPGEEEEM